MSKLFYDHLIIIEDITLILDKYNITKEERGKILSLIDKTLHHSILNTILSHLPKNHHEVFLNKFTSYPYDLKLLTFLKDHTEVDIEIEILNTASSVKKTILKEIERSKKNS